MNDTNILLLNLIRECKTLNEISEITGLSNKQIFMRLSMLKNSGYKFDRLFFNNGEILYKINNIFDDKESYVKRIYSNNNIDSIKLMLISDTHLGNLRDNIECIDKMYDYCIKNNINIILNAGDFIDGIYEDTKDKKIINPSDQISYVLKNYPYDKNILNVMCLGNHDATFYIECGIDLKELLENYRNDIAITGYGYGIVNINENDIVMKHPIDRLGLRFPICCGNQIVLRGHSHKYRITNSSNALNIFLPSLSNVRVVDTFLYPGMVEMELNFNNKIITSVNLIQYVFTNNKFYKISEISYEIGYQSLVNEYENMKIRKNIEPKNLGFTGEKVRKRK